MPIATPATTHQHELMRSFERDVRDVLHRLRSAIAALIHGISATSGSGPLQRPTDLQRTLKIRSTLAWRIHRFAIADEPIHEAIRLPGPTAMSRFFNAVRKKGVAEATIRTAEQAMREFDALVKHYASTRAEFDSMLADLAGEAGHAVELNHRKAAYNANSHIWGVQVRTRFTSMLYHRSSDTLIDVANIHGVIDLRQMRAHRPFVLSRSHVERTPGERLAQPIDPQSFAQYGVSVLPEFCSAPTPRIQTYTDSNGELIAELVPRAMGRSGAVSAVVASHYKDFGFRFSTQEVPTVTTIGRIDTPYEVCVADILIEDGAYGDVLPNLWSRVVGPFIAGHFDEKDEKGTLWYQPTSYLGRGSTVLSTADIPRYVEMVNSVTERLGWNAESFHAFRCRVEYPVMPSMIVLGFDIPLTRDQLSVQTESAAR